MSHQKRSLELLVAEGEQESKVIDGKNYFVYELLMSSGEWFEKKKKRFLFWESSIESIGSPRLPRHPPPLGQLLDESGILRGGGGNHGIFGFEDTCPVLLYVPGDTPQQAKEGLNQYRNKLDEALAPSRKYYSPKVRPVMVGKHKYPV